tara:strand:+ start:121 stop:567 length:447 start_codon:yes stop_codon:yes gene_type:complete
MTTPLGHKTFESWQKATKLNKISKINLSLADEVKETAKRLMNVENKGMDVAKNGLDLVAEIVKFADSKKASVKNTIKEIEEAFTEIDGMQNRANDIEIKVNAQAKELGIDPGDIPFYEDMIESAEEVDDVSSDLQTAKEQLDIILINL